MKLLTRLLSRLLANLLGIMILHWWIPGVSVSPFHAREIVVLAFIFTLLNVIVKPLAKIVLFPLIALTLGIGFLGLNALMLYLLDLFSENITIQGIPALIYGTLVMSAVNFIVHRATKS